MKTLKNMIFSLVMIASSMNLYTSHFYTSSPITITTTTHENNSSKARQFKPLNTNEFNGLLSALLELDKAESLDSTALKTNLDSRDAQLTSLQFKVKNDNRLQRPRFKNLQGLSQQTVQTVELKKKVQKLQALEHENQQLKKMINMGVASLFFTSGLLNIAHK